VEPNEASSGVRGSWRKRLSVNDDAFVLLSSRLVRPNYNIDTIIRALPIVLRRCPQAVLVLKELPIHSDRQYRDACMNLVETLGVADAIRVVGELDRTELLELHASADLLVS